MRRPIAPRSGVDIARPLAAIAGAASGPSGTPIRDRSSITARIEPTSTCRGTVITSPAG